jgi:hypothetical protein
MNIHLPAICMFTRGTRFWPTAMYCHVLPSHKWQQWKSAKPYKTCCTESTGTGASAPVRVPGMAPLRWGAPTRDR